MKRYLIPLFGFLALAVFLAIGLGRDPRELPSPLVGRAAPAFDVPRLAVDAQWRGQGLGSALLSDALRRCLAASEIAGARSVVAHATGVGPRTSRICARSATRVESATHASSFQKPYRPKSRSR